MQRGQSNCHASSRRHSGQAVGLEKAGAAPGQDGRPMLGKKSTKLPRFGHSRYPEVRPNVASESFSADRYVARGRGMSASPPIAPKFGRSSERSTMDMPRDLFDHYVSEGPQLLANAPRIAPFATLGHVATPPKTTSTKAGNNMGCRSPSLSTNL